MDIKIKSAKWMICLFAILAIIYYLYSDSIVSYISTLHPLLIILATTILSPIDILFICFLWKNYGFRGAIAGFGVSLASSIISLPHIYLMNGQYNANSYSLTTESTFFNLLPQYLRDGVVNLPFGQVNLGVLLVYLGISIGLVILALMILHKKKFKEVFMNSV